MNFTEVELTEDFPQDSSPPLSDVEFPCKVCGKESGPYGGRGPKPKFCPEHKKVTKGTRPRVTGQPAQLAAQATAVLVQLNGLMAAGSMAMGLFKTAHAIAESNDTFEQQAHAALITDPELCRLILKSGMKSAKLSLGLAYVGMGMTVVPTAIMEMRDKKAERDARKEEELQNA